MLLMLGIYISLRDVGPFSSLVSLCSSLNLRFDTILFMTWGLADVLVRPCKKTPILAKWYRRFMSLCYVAFVYKHLFVDLCWGRKQVSCVSETYRYLVLLALRIDFVQKFI